jgi:hypothetical protein
VGAAVLSKLGLAADSVQAVRSRVTSREPTFSSERSLPSLSSKRRSTTSRDTLMGQVNPIALYAALFLAPLIQYTLIFLAFGILLTTVVT